MNSQCNSTAMKALPPKRAGMTYLVCSPTKIICCNVSLRNRIVGMDPAYVIFGLEISGDIQLVHANGR